MVSPNFLNRLPGYPYSGDDHDGFLTSREMVDYLDGYARVASVPRSTTARRSSRSSRRAIISSCGRTWARSTPAPWSWRRVPISVRSSRRSASSIPTRVFQIHADRYWEPDHLPKGDVLVVGGGQSGTQIALELRSAGRAVYLSAGRCAWYPRRLYGRDILWWRDQMGEFETLVDTLPDPAAARLACTPLIRWGEKDLSLRTLADEGVTLLGRFSGAKGEMASFAPDLHSSIAYGDEAARGFVARIHAFALSRGDIHQPSPSPWLEPGRAGSCRLSGPNWTSAASRRSCGPRDIDRISDGSTCRSGTPKATPSNVVARPNTRVSGSWACTSCPAADPASSSVSDSTRPRSPRDPAASIGVLTGRTQGAPGDSDRCPRRG